MPVDPLSVVCPACDANVDAGCVSWRGNRWRSRETPHFERIEAALIHAAAAPVASGEHVADDDAIHNALKYSGDF